MSASDQQHWDNRYRSGEFSYRLTDAFVTEAHENYLSPLLPAQSTGLDLAGGAGHHAIWLAQQGWRMTLADWSQVALDIARQQATEACVDIEMASGPALDTIQQFASKSRRFGFILVSFFLERALLPLLPKLLQPGGLLLYRTYTTENESLGNPRGPRNPEYLLRSQELLDVYRGMKVLHYQETVIGKGIVEFIAQQKADN